MEGRHTKLTKVNEDNEEGFTDLNFFLTLEQLALELQMPVNPIAKVRSIFGK